MPDDKQYYCEKCNRTMSGDNFYASNNLEKYPNDGKFPVCKKCMTMHVDNWNPDTFLWILQDADVPWIPDEWNKLMASYSRDGKKITGMTILGRYLSKMKLKQWREYRWKDTEFLQELQNSKIEQTMKRQGYDAQQIADAINKASFEIPIGELREPEYPDTPASDEPTEDYFANRAGVVEQTAEDLGLTDEDVTYLRLKWGKAYKPEEWVALEQLYTEMMESYDIQTAGHIDTLKMLCKTSLKSNQLLDIGDVDGAQKMLKMYDMLMKSGKFTAAQNKAENGEFVDSISQLVSVCEQEGFIPRYYTDGPMDRVDETLLDIKGYINTLVTEEMNLGNLIESAVKQMAQEEAKEEDEDDDDELLSFEELDALRDEDYEEFGDFISEEEEADAATLIQLGRVQ